MGFQKLAAGASSTSLPRTWMPSTVVVVEVEVGIIDRLCAMNRTWPCCRRALKEGHDGACMETFRGNGLVGDDQF